MAWKERVCLASAMLSRRCSPHTPPLLQPQQLQRQRCEAWLAGGSAGCVWRCAAGLVLAPWVHIEASGCIWPPTDGS